MAMAKERVVVVHENIYVLILIMGTAPLGTTASLNTAALFVTNLVTDHIIVGRHKDLVVRLVVDRTQWGRIIGRVTKTETRIDGTIMKRKLTTVG